MERFLIALDCTPGSLKAVYYVNRVLNGAVQAHFTLFHVMPTTSPNLLKKEEVNRIGRMHEEHPHLSGYFWNLEDEEQMQHTFDEAKQLLIDGGFHEAQVSTFFCVQSAEIAHVILANAERLGCSTIVMGRRRLGRVKEFLLGSVSSNVLKHAKEITVWVVDF